MLQPLVKDHAPFFEYAARGELRVQTCKDCGEVRLPPRPTCPHCRSDASEWKRVSGWGTVSAFAQYPAVVVELAEDRSLRLVGDLVPDVDAPPGAPGPATVEIGDPVRVAFREIEGVTVACWTPHE